MSAFTNPPVYRMSVQMKILLLVGISVGVVCWKLMSLQNETRAWYEFLVGLVLFLGLGLFGFFFTAIQHITSAKWSVGLRRILEAMSLTLPVAAILFIPILGGFHHIYEWSHSSAMAHDDLLKWKAPFLNEGFFKLRMLMYFSIWILGSAWLVRNSLKQDVSRDVRYTEANRRISALSLVLFGLSVSMAGFDILMSVEPHWFSTIFGIYFFAGFFQSGLCMFYILAWILYRAGTLKGVINEDHFHDISRFIFGFSIFWTYIAFSQYILIWYGDLPEETFFYKVRMEGNWGALGMLLLGIRFVFPFLALMSYYAKRNINLMLVVSIVLIFGEWLDLYWVTFPGIRLIEDVNGIPAVISWKDIGVGIGFLSLFLAVVGLIMERIRMIPVGDPRLESSIHYYHH